MRLEASTETHSSVEIQRCGHGKRGQSGLLFTIFFAVFMLYPATTEMAPKEWREGNLK